MADAATAPPPRIPATGIDAERRLVGQALTLWETLRDGRPFPSRADCTAPRVGALAPRPRVGALAPSTFLIRVSDSEDGDRVVDCGPVLRDALGSDPVGQPVNRILPSATERGLAFWRVAAELKKPIADIGSFTNAAGSEVLYRSVLLPLSDDQQRIDYLLGAFSFRLAP